jgi:hypothetical protein
VRWIEQASHVPFGHWYTAGALTACVTRDGEDSRWHLSVSHPTRYSTFDEIKEARYTLIPDEVVMAMMFPPRREYVNLHPNCFHLYEVRGQ